MGTEVAPKRKESIYLLLGVVINISLPKTRLGLWLVRANLEPCFGLVKTIKLNLSVGVLGLLFLCAVGEM